MNYTIEMRDKIATCVMSGHLTFSDHDSYRAMLDQALDKGAETVVLDLEKLEFIDSAGMGMLLVGQDKSSGAAWHFELRSPKGQVKKMLDLAQLNQVISIK